MRRMMFSRPPRRTFVASSALWLLATLLPSTVRALSLRRTQPPPPAPGWWDWLRENLCHVKPSVNARDLYSQGVVLRSRGDYQGAIEKWEQLQRLRNAGEWGPRAKAHVDRAKRILELQRAAAPAP